MIYLDHAATTKISPAARDAMIAALDTYGNPSSVHTLGQQASAELGRARETIARQLGASPREIYFTSGGSEGDNQALLTGAKNGAAAGKRHIISTAMEHHAVLHTLEALEQQGFSVTYLKPDSEGRISPRQLEEAIRPDTALVSVMYVNNETGSVQPIRELAAVCHGHEIPLHTDAVQAVGHIPVDVKADGVDFLTLSAHKFHGPRGIGALYVRRGIRLHSLIDGGGQERGKRAGTENLPGIAGMAAALEEETAQLKKHMDYVEGLRNTLVAGLREIPHARINESPQHHAPGIVNVSFAGVEGESLLLLLDSAGICASAGSACSAGSLESSHVLLSMGIPRDIAQGSLRLSLDHSNTPEEVSEAIAQDRAVVERLRKMRR